MASTARDTWNWKELFNSVIFDARLSKSSRRPQKKAVHVESIQLRTFKVSCRSNKFFFYLTATYDAVERKFSMSEAHAL